MPLPAWSGTVSVGATAVWLLVGAMTRSWEHRVAVAKPVLVAVDDDDAGLPTQTLELESRYGTHYQVVSGS